MNDFDKIEQIKIEAEKLGLTENRALVQLLLDIQKQNQSEMQSVIQSANEMRKIKKTGIICATICAIAVMIFVAVLAITATGITVNHESVTQDAYSSGTNNVYQDGENAQYIEEGDK